MINDYIPDIFGQPCNSEISLVSAGWSCHGPMTLMRLIQSRHRDIFLSQTSDTRWSRRPHIPRLPSARGQGVYEAVVVVVEVVMLSLLNQ